MQISLLCSPDAAETAVFFHPSLPIDSVRRDSYFYRVLQRPLGLYGWSACVDSVARLGVHGGLAAFSRASYLEPWQRQLSGKSCFMTWGSTGLIAVVVTLRCRIHWAREFAGQGPARRTFLPSLAAVAGYYGILLRWFRELIPNT